MSEVFAVHCLSRLLTLRKFLREHFFPPFNPLLEELSQKLSTARWTCVTRRQSQWVSVSPFLPLIRTERWYNWCSLYERLGRLERKRKRKSRMFQIDAYRGDTGRGGEGREEELEEGLSHHSRWAFEPHWAEGVHIGVCLEWVSFVGEQLRPKIRPKHFSTATRTWSYLRNWSRRISIIWASSTWSIVPSFSQPFNFFMSSTRTDPMMWRDRARRMMKIDWTIFRRKIPSRRLVDDTSRGTLAATKAHCSPPSKPRSRRTALTTQYCRSARAMCSSGWRTLDCRPKSHKTSRQNEDWCERASSGVPLTVMKSALEARAERWARSQVIPVSAAARCPDRLEIISSKTKAIILINFSIKSNQNPLVIRVEPG